MYVLGMLLYCFKDGGEIFMFDGGSDGIYVDYYVMWINFNDGCNIVLGNDGGFYIINDCMIYWDYLVYIVIG